MTTDLIARLEAAEGPSRELDEAIYEHIGATRPAPGELYWRAPDGNRHYGALIPHFSQSMDAAWRMVPRGWIVGIYRGFDDDGEPWSRVLLIDSFSIGPGCTPEDRREVTSYGSGEPPRFISAAALKAQAATQEREKEIGG